MKTVSMGELERTFGELCKTKQAIQVLQGQQQHQTEELVAELIAAGWHDCFTVNLNKIDTRLRRNRR